MLLNKRYIALMATSFFMLTFHKTLIPFNPTVPLFDYRQHNDGITVSVAGFPVLGNHDKHNGWISGIAAFGVTAGLHWWVKNPLKKEEDVSQEKNSLRASYTQLAYQVLQDPKKRCAVGMFSGVAAQELANQVSNAQEEDPQKKKPLFSAFKDLIVWGYAHVGSVLGESSAGGCIKRINDYKQYVKTNHEKKLTEAETKIKKELTEARNLLQNYCEIIKCYEDICAEGCKCIGGNDLELYKTIRAQQEELAQGIANLHALQEKNFHAEGLNKNLKVEIALLRDRLNFLTQLTAKAFEAEGDAILNKTLGQAEMMLFEQCQKAFECELNNMYELCNQQQRLMQAHEVQLMGFHDKDYGVTKNPSTQVIIPKLDFDNLESLRSSSEPTTPRSDGSRYSGESTPLTGEYAVNERNLQDQERQLEKALEAIKSARGGGPLIVPDPVSLVHAQTQCDASGTSCVAIQCANNFADAATQSQNFECKELAIQTEDPHVVSVLPLNRQQPIFGRSRLVDWHTVPHVAGMEQHLRRMGR